MKYKKLDPKINYDIDSPNTLRKTNKKVFPLPFRCLIVGTSGCGKTTLIYNLITKEWDIPFHSLYIFSKSIEQDVYRDLKRMYDKLSVEEDAEIAHFYNNSEDIIPVDECEPNSLIIFDDCVNMRQQYIIKDYFVRGLHKNISCIYLAQSYTKIDRQLIRNNINFLCVFKQSPKYMKYIYDEYVGSDFTFNEFKAICDSCWNDDYGFLSIDTEKKLNSRRYRKKFDLEIQS